MNTDPRCPHCNKSNMPLATGRSAYEHQQCPNCGLHSRVKKVTIKGGQVAVYVKDGRRGLGLVHRSLRVESEQAAFFDAHPDTVNRHVIALGIAKFHADMCHETV